MKKSIKLILLLEVLLIFSGISSLIISSSVAIPVQETGTFSAQDFLTPTITSWEHYSSNSYVKFTAVDIDSTGNVYVTGMMINATNTYSIVVKFDSNMNEVWNTTEILIGNGHITDISVDSEGYIYTVGYRENTAPPNEYFGFYYKYNNTGFQQSGSTYYSSYTSLVTSAIDDLGYQEIVFCGYLQNYDGSYNATIVERVDHGLNGTSWSNTFTPTNKELYLFDIEASSLGDILVTGWVNSSTNHKDIFIGKFSGTMGGQIWNNTCFSGPKNDLANEIELTGNNIYVAGEKESYSSDIFSDAYLAKLDLNGDVVWNASFDCKPNENQGESVYGLAITDNDNAIICGYDLGTYSFIAEFSSAGSLLWNYTIDFSAMYFEDVEYRATDGKIFAVGTKDSSGNYAGGIYVFDYHPPQNDANSGDDAGDNFSSALLISAGTHQGSLYLDDINDWYQFSVTIGDRIDVSLTGDVGTDFDIWLNDPIGTSKASSAALTYPDAFSFVADSSGNWRVLVNKITGEGDYSLTITITSPSTSPTPTSPSPTPSPSGNFFADNWYWFAIGGGGLLVLVIVIVIVKIARRK